MNSASTSFPHVIVIDDDNAPLAQLKCQKPQAVGGRLVPVGIEAQQGYPLWQFQRRKSVPKPTFNDRKAPTLAKFKASRASSSVALQLL